MKQNLYNTTSNLSLLILLLLGISNLANAQVNIGNLADKQVINSRLERIDTRVQQTVSRLMVRQARFDKVELEPGLRYFQSRNDGFFATSLIKQARNLQPKDFEKGIDVFYTYVSQTYADILGLPAGYYIGRITGTPGEEVKAELVDPQSRRIVGTYEAFVETMEDEDAMLSLGGAAEDRDFSLLANIPTEINGRPFHFWIHFWIHIWISF